MLINSTVHELNGLNTFCHGKSIRHKEELCKSTHSSLLVTSKEWALDWNMESFYAKYSWVSLILTLMMVVLTSVVQVSIPAISDWEASDRPSAFQCWVGPRTFAWRSLSLCQIEYLSITLDDAINWYANQYFLLIAWPGTGAARCSQQWAHHIFMFIAS